jgi:MFS family permease
MDGGNRFLTTARLTVLLSGGALAAMVQLAILPSLTQMAAHFSSQGGVLDSATIAQLVLTVAAPTMALGAPVAGWIAGRFGKRPVLLLSLLLYALSGAIGAVAPDLWTMLASRLVLGLASAGFGTAAIAIIGDQYVGDRRDRLIGMYAFLGSGGALIGLPLAGVMAESGWQTPFALYLIALPLFLLALAAVREPAREEIAKTATSGGSMRSATGLFILIVAISIVLYMVSVQGPFLLQADGIADPTTQSIIIDLATAGSMVSAYLFAYLRPKWGFTPILSLTWVALGLGSLGFGMVHGIAAHCVFAALSGFGSGFMAPLTQTAIINVVSAEARPKALGLGFGLMFLGMFIQPFLLAPLRAGVGIGGTFVWVGGVAVVIGVLTLLRGFRSVGTPRAA